MMYFVIIHNGFYVFLHLGDSVCQGVIGSEQQLTREFPCELFKGLFEEGSEKFRLVNLTIKAGSDVLEIDMGFILLEKVGDEENKNDKEGEEVQISVLKVDMHCHACVKKVVKALRRSPGVEDIVVDRMASTIAVKGNIADPTNLCDIIRSKTGRNALLISPLPKPPVEEQPKDDSNTESSQNNDQPPAIVTIVLRIQMHCEACAQLLRKRIRKVKGIESVETNLAKGEVKVTGIIPNPEELVQYVYKRTRKQVSIVKDEEKKEDKETKKDIETEVMKNDEDNSMTTSEVMRNEHHWETSSSRYSYMEHHNSLNYDPQFLSEDDPNACSIM